MSELAAELQVVLPVSVFERANNALYNSLVMLDADGRSLGVYRKTHILMLLATRRSSISTQATRAFPFGKLGTPRSGPSFAGTSGFRNRPEFWP